MIVDEFYSNKRELNVFEWSFTCVCDFPSFIIAPYNPNNIHCDDPFSLFYDPSIEANQQTEVNLFNLYKSNILRIEHAKRMFGSLTLNERLIYLVFLYHHQFRYTLRAEGSRVHSNDQRDNSSRKQTRFFPNTNSWTKNPNFSETL